jgi:para-aminobenzoate synthetase component I
VTSQLETFRAEMNNRIWRKEPFVFIIDFEMERPRLWDLKVDPGEILFDFNGVSNAPPVSEISNAVLERYPVSLSIYQRKFDKVMERLLYGDSFLTNLTIRTPVGSKLSLRQLFDACKARYRFWMKDSFLVFSPETFVKISNNKIYSYPMKGTIDASIVNAEERILSDQKEMAEHVTIVDLIRNDLSMVATNVRVGKFRYIDRISAKGKELLQVSSEITGDLMPRYNSDPAGCLISLLPAGSITGAPKAKTVDVIKETEGERRGYYTGICGTFDGTTLDSGVMIRYIEQQGSNLFYRSGGGITTQSNVLSEYQEVQDKIYVPIN